MGQVLQNAIVVVTGARGTGKSLFALTYYQPEQALLNRVFIHDAERSSNRAVQEMEAAGLEFGEYRDLNARFKNLPSSDDLLNRIDKGDLPWLTGDEKGALRSYYEYVVSDLNENLTEGKYDVYIHDPIEKLEGGMAAWCEDNIKLFGYRNMKAAMQYGRFWSDVVYSLYENLVSSLFNRGVKVIIFTSHLKTPWQDKQPVPGKVAPGGKPLLYKLSSFMVWLVNEEANPDGAPAGLVLKERLGKMGVDEGEWKIRRMIPRRIPHCTWKDIRRYLENGCDLVNPAPGETMSKDEKNTISELLTNEQMRLMILSAEERLKNGHSQDEKQDTGVPVSTATVSFNFPTPEYQRAKGKADELSNQGIEVTEAGLLGAFAPPARGKQAVKDAVVKVMGETR